MAEQLAELNKGTDKYTTQTVTDAQGRTFKFERKGDICTLTVDVGTSTLPEGTYALIPSSYLPKNNYYVAIGRPAQGTIGIMADGNINAWGTIGAYSATSFTYLSAEA